MSSSLHRLPAEVWLYIVEFLPQPSAHNPRPAQLSALSAADRFLHAVIRRVFFTRLFFVNPRAQSPLDLPAFVRSHLTQLKRNRHLRNVVTEVVVHSHESEPGLKYNYPEFLHALAPFEQILRLLSKSRSLRRVELHKFVVTILGHVALYKLRHLEFLELDYTYLVPLPEIMPPPESKLRQLHNIVIRKETSVKDQAEVDTLLALILAAPALRTLQADEPLLSFLARRRKRLPLEHLVVALPNKDVHALLRCCLALRSIEFGFMPIHPPPPDAAPRLQRYRGPTAGVCAYVPGRPVQHVDITGTCDADQFVGIVPCLLRATAPTKSLKFALATRGSVAFRVGKLAGLASLPQLGQLVLDSDFACQSDEAFAREFTERVAGRLPHLASLDVVGAERPSASLTQHIGDSRMQQYMRTQMFAAPPEPAPWELELAREWAARTPGLRSVSWGVWKWVRKGDDWSRVPRDICVRLRDD